MSRQYNVLNKHILNYASLHPVHIRGLVAISAKYTTRQAYNVTSHMHMPMHPLYQLFQRRWETRTESLWWSAIAHKTLENKRVVRSWAARRLRLAFVGALKKNGFDVTGRPIESSKTNIPSLFGTLQLTPNAGIMKASREQLEGEAHILIQYIIKQQRNGGSEGGQLLCFPRSK